MEEGEVDLVYGKQDREVVHGGKRKEGTAWKT